jgi:hypothetical protein
VGREKAFDGMLTIVLRSRKSGNAPVGMTILWPGNASKAVKRMAVDGPTELSSRPERSAVEGPAVSLPVLTQTLAPATAKSARNAGSKAALSSTRLLFTAAKASAGKS